MDCVRMCLCSVFLCSFGFLFSYLVIGKLRLKLFFRCFCSFGIFYIFFSDCGGM